MTWQQESSQLHVVYIYTSTCAHTFPALCFQVQGRTQLAHQCAAGLLGTQQA
jgi:hypothetical protein